MINLLKILLLNFLIILSSQSFSQYNCIYEVGEETRDFDISRLRASPIKPVINENTFIDNLRFCRIPTNNVYPSVSINDAFQKRDSVNALFITDFRCKKLDSTELFELEKLTNICILFTINGFENCDFYLKKKIGNENLHKLARHFHCLDKIKYCQLPLIDSFFINNIDTMYKLTYLRSDFADENIDLGKFPNLDTLYCGTIFRNSVTKLHKLSFLEYKGQFFSELYNLTSLHQLNLFVPRLTGHNLFVVNKQINRMSNLEVLAINAASIQFEKSVCIENLKRLLLSSSYYWTKGKYFKNADTLILPVRKLKNIEELYINCFTKVENINSIYKFKKLRVLCIHNSKIEQLPSKIGSLNSLREVIIVGCDISPNVIYRLIKSIDHPIFLQLGEIILTDSIMTALSENKYITHLRIDAAMFNKVKDYSKFKNITNLEISTEYIWYLKESFPKDFCINKYDFKKIQESLPNTVFTFFNLNGDSEISISSRSVYYYNRQYETF